MTERIARLHIALADADPPIWRRVEVPVDASLKMIHDVIQRAMGWLDYHLWEFETADRRFGLRDRDWPDDQLSSAANTRLGALVDRGVRRFEYTYDMGDNWLHLVAVEAVEDGEPGVKYPRYVDGAGRAPPEDVGGIPGFEAFLEAIADPNHPEHAQATEWHEECYGTAFDPGRFDELQVRLAVGDLAKRRAAGKAAARKRST